MKVFITGATGFLGQNLAKFLVDKHHDITVVGRDTERLNSLFPQVFLSKRKTDYSVESLVELTKGADVIIHLASQLMQRDTHPLKISDFNETLQIVENLILACEENKVTKFINTSSISVYPLEQGLAENHALSPWNIYGVSKGNIDIYLQYIQKKIDTSIISVRLARLYGYGERAGLMFTNFISKAQNRETLQVNGGGKATIEYIYIEDAIDALYALLECKDCRGIYNVGAGVAYSVKEIATIVNRVFGNDGNVEFLANKPDGVEGTLMDVSKMRTEMNWAAKWNLYESVQDVKIKIENERK